MRFGNFTTKIVSALVAAAFVAALVPPPQEARAQLAGGQELASAALEIGLSAAAITAVALGTKWLVEFLSDTEAGVAEGADILIGKSVAVPIVDVGAKSTDRTRTSSKTDQNTEIEWWKEYVLDPIGNLTAKIVLRTLTNQVLAWIQGGDVGFVDNLTRQARVAADEAGGEFLNNLAGMNLCGNIYASLNIMLQTPPLRQRFTCTLSDIVRNVESFYRNFEQGGWAAFLRINVQPQNNVYGAFLITLDTKLAKERQAQERDEKTLLANNGFLGVRVPVRGNCEFQSESKAFTLPPSAEGATQVKAPQKNQNRFAAVLGIPSAGAQPEGRFIETGLNKNQLSQEELGRIVVEQAQIRDASDQDQQRFTPEQIKEQIETSEFVCETEYQIKTAGDVIAHGLKKITWSGLDVAVAADEINESIAAIINALVNKLIRASAVVTRGGGGGVSTGGTVGTISGHRVGPDGTITGHGGEGLSDSSLTQPTRIDPQQFGGFNVPGKNFISSVYESYAILAEINTKLAAARNLLFAKQKAMDDILQSNTSPIDRAQQLAPLRTEVARLDALIAKRLEQKRKMIAAQAELLSFKGIFLDIEIFPSTVVSPEEKQTALEQKQTALEQWLTAIKNLIADETSSAPRKTTEETLNLTTAVNSERRSITRDIISAARRIVTEEGTRVDAEQQLLRNTIAEIDRIAAAPLHEVCEGEPSANQTCFNRGPAKERLARERAALITRQLLFETKLSQIKQDEKFLFQPQTNTEEAARVIAKDALDINRDVGAAITETSSVDAIIRPIYQ